MVASLNLNGHSVGYDAIGLDNNWNYAAPRYACRHQHVHLIQAYKLLLRSGVEHLCSSASDAGCNSRCAANAGRIQAEVNRAAL